jgi:hypothetical protein
MTDKYTFRREYKDYYGQLKTIEHSIEGETLDEILEAFLYFLNGCSFSYVKDIIWVREDGTEVPVIGYLDTLPLPDDIENVDQLSLVLDNMEKISGR